LFDSVTPFTVISLAEISINDCKGCESSELKDSLNSKQKASTN